MLRSIQGDDGELVDLFLELIDRETDSDEHWWFNLGSLSGRHVGLYPPGDTPRKLLIAALRERISDLLAAGLSEPFLIKHLKLDLDSWFSDRSDTSQWDRRAEEMREHIQNVIDDPMVRARWRDTLAKNNPEYAGKTDDEMIAEARRTLDRGVITRKTTPEDAAQKWAQAQEWVMLTEELLPAEIYSHWSLLNVQRALDAKRQR